MRIAISQLSIAYEDKLRNIEKANQAIEFARKQKAELIVFPEMSFTGFSMKLEQIGETDESTVQQMQCLSNEHQIYIGFGWVKLIELNNERKGENHYTIVSPEGKVILDYVKCHPFSYSGENVHFVGGENVRFCKISDFIISVNICYDLRFPEIFQAESKIADLIIVPANWPKERREHWSTLLRARSIENQSYMIGVNCIGESGGVEYSGDSVVIDAAGNVLLSLIKEEIGVIDIENDVNIVRNRFPMKRDRREKLYNKLYSQVESMSINMEED